MKFGVLLDFLNSRFAFCFVF